MQAVTATTQRLLHTDRSPTLQDSALPPLGTKPHHSNDALAILC